MRRLLLAAAVAAAVFAPQGPANADLCASTLICGVSGCRGTVNVCGGTQTCSGTMSVCPFSYPSQCTSTVDVCVGPIYARCGTAIEQVCRLLGS